MNCPACGADTHVLSSRETKAGYLRRYRRCTACAHSFSTVEIPADMAQVIGLLATAFRDKTVRPSRRGKTPKPKRSGVIVPPEQEADWKTLKKAGYSDPEAASSLGLAIPE